MGALILILKKFAEILKITTDIKKIKIFKKSPWPKSCQNLKNCLNLLNCTNLIIQKAGHEKIKSAHDLKNPSKPLIFTDTIAISLKTKDFGSQTNSSKTP